MSFLSFPYRIIIIYDEPIGIYVSFSMLTLEYNYPPPSILLCRKEPEWWIIIY